MSTNVLREYGPLKQGLRHFYNPTLFQSRILREHGPLKQGLRLLSIILRPLSDSLREHGPLKQGLRRVFTPFMLTYPTAPRVWSTKTRIKTQHLCSIYLRPALSESMVH